MKPFVVYALVVAGGATAGAVGVGSWNVFVQGVTVEEIAEVGPEGAGEEEASQSHETSPSEASLAEGGAPRPVNAAGGETEEHAETVASAPDPVVAPPGSTPPPEASAPTDSESGPTPAVVPAVAAPVRAPDPDSLARVTQNYQRLARIFSAMRPDEAAPVLAQLEDSQLEGILMAMQGRNAAPILAEMDPDRAAALSRRVLREPQ